MRSAALRITGRSYSTERSASIGPPSTMMPSGARTASHRGNRLSRGYSSKLPSGEKAQSASSPTETIRSRRPARANRVVKSSRPTTPRPTKKFVGSNMTPSVYDSAKNKGSLAHYLLKRHTLSLRIAQAPAFSLVRCRNSAHDASSSPFQPRDLPLGLLRSQAEARAHHRKRRRSDRRDHLGRPGHGAGQGQISCAAGTA